MNMPYYRGTLARKQEADLVLSCFHFFDALRHTQLIAPDYLILDARYHVTRLITQQDSFGQLIVPWCLFIEEALMFKRPLSCYSNKDNGEKRYNKCNLHTRFCNTDESFNNL